MQTYLWMLTWIEVFFVHCINPRACCVCACVETPAYLSRVPLSASFLMSAHSWDSVQSHDSVLGARLIKLAWHYSTGPTSLSVWVCVKHLCFSCHGFSQCFHIHTKEMIQLSLLLLCEDSSSCFSYIHVHIHTWQQWSFSPSDDSTHRQTSLSFSLSLPKARVIYMNIITVQTAAGINIYCGEETLGQLVSVWRARAMCHVGLNSRMPRC